MSTRNLTMVVDRVWAKKSDLGFARDPSEVSKQSLVNMYLHHDGYPQWQGVQLAEWCNVNNTQDGPKLAAKLVHDHYYDSCYLYSNMENIDHQYTYIIWTGKKDIWISCYDRYSNKCIFVHEPDTIIKKYWDDMEYTNFAGGETRYMKSNHEDIKYHSKKLLELLSHFSN